MWLIFSFVLLAGASPDERYVFFLHNKFIEEHTLNEAHPKYGVAEYSKIVGAFEQAGFTVISEKRAAHTDVNTYARKVTNQLDSLLERGVVPDHITVVGTSKGGYIAQRISSFAHNPRLNFVFIGSSFSGDANVLPDLNLCGNILAINETSDEGSVSLEGRIEASTCDIIRFKEIELNTGKEHGFLFALLDEWFEPARQWASGNYR